MSNADYLPFFITAPGEGDLLFTAVIVFLVLVAIGFGTLYFTIQAIPDRLANGASKVQLQIVGILGLLSLFTMNNAFWVAALLLAAIRIPDIITPLKEIALEMRRNRAVELPPAEPVAEDPGTLETTGDQEGKADD